MTLHDESTKLAKALLLPINPAAVVLLGFYTVVWGLWVANPFWSVFGTAPLYSFLASLAPEVFWGGLAILCGAITSYGAVKRKYRPLVIGSAVAFWHWLMIGVMYFAGDPLNTGGVTAIMLAVYAAFVYLNIRTNFKEDTHSERLLRP